MARRCSGADPMAGRCLVSIALAIAAPLAAPLALAQTAATDDARVQSLARGTLSAEAASGYATGVLAVFALLGVLFFVARWMQGRVGQARGALRVQACLGLGGKERLMVVNAEGERLLLGVSPGGVHLIRVLEAEVDDVRTSDTSQKGAWLTRTLSGDGA